MTTAPTMTDHAEQRGRRQSVFGEQHPGEDGRRNRDQARHHAGHDARRELLAGEPDAVPDGDPEDASPNDREDVRARRGAPHPGSGDHVAEQHHTGDVVAERHEEERREGLQPNLDGGEGEPPRPGDHDERGDIPNATHPWSRVVDTRVGASDHRGVECWKFTCDTLHPSP